MAEREMERLQRGAERIGSAGLLQQFKSRIKFDIAKCDFVFAEQVGILLGIESRHFLLICLRFALIAALRLLANAGCAIPEIIERHQAFQRVNHAVLEFADAPPMQGKQKHLFGAFPVIRRRHHDVEFAKRVIGVSQLFFDDRLFL